MTEEPAAMSDGKTGKSPITRLLDLTVGWAEYVEATEKEYPDIVSSEEILGLYQAVSGYAWAEWEGTGEEQADVVRRFVEELLMPVLLRK